MSKQSIKAAVRDAVREEKRVRKSIIGAGTTLDVATMDSFVNLSQKMGIGADSPLSTASYGFNPITRDRVKLEWIHRGSWLGGMAIDIIADDMTRAGIEYVSELKPDAAEKLDMENVRLDSWNKINETIKWSRLYGGCLAVLMIDGQDFSTPLNIDTIGPDAYKGLLVLDRWMVEPSLEDLVTDLGPHLGLPKYYRIQTNAPALRGKAVHHSRVALRLEGIQLPYQQKLTENLWGISVLERLYDRMIAFDSATTGAAQLVYKSFLRTLSVKSLRDIVAGPEAARNGLVQYMQMMSRYQGIEGITLIDSEDTFETQTHGAFSGLSDALMQFGQQLSGALQIPLTRLFGQSPAGLSATGESDLITYYDHIKQKQMKDLHHGVTTHYRCLAKSKKVKLPDNFQLGFKSLWEMTDTEKVDVANKAAEAVVKALDAMLIGRKTALKELRQASRITGYFTNITEEMIEEADDEVNPPTGAELLAQVGYGEGGEEENADKGNPNEIRPTGQESPPAGGKKVRNKVLQPTP